MADMTVDLNQRTAANRPAFNPGMRITIVVAALFIAGALLLNGAVSWRQSVLFLLAGIGGLTLYHAHYGFTTAFRDFINEGRGAAIRSHMLMFVIASVLFLPLLTAGSFLGKPMAGYVSPVGLSVVFGAFLFGLCMQVADGCASGTLYHLGGGDLRAILTIIGYVGGSLLATAHFAWWMATPSFAPVSLIKSFGIGGGLLIQVLIAGAVVLLTLWVERRRKVTPLPAKATEVHGWQKLYKGPWSLLWGGVVLAVLNAAILAISGKPWGVTSAFAVWGAKLAQAAGISVQNWSYWQVPANAAALHKSLLFDVNTVMDIGLMLGALLAAALAGRFVRPVARRFPIGMTVGALLGGVGMGYGARIAFGCNIGAYFGGIASFSVHGWVWMVAAMLGSVIGVRLRPYCSMAK
ncbi:MAG: putative inner rane protein [Firmicutes bacterium]|nr:putative inner rane protein [Bacillota bacterium]